MKQAVFRDYEFDPKEYETDLRAIFEEVEALSEIDTRSVDRILRRYPKNGKGIFSRSELIAGYRLLSESDSGSPAREDVIEKLRMKPVRSLSGVTPVTILTKPFPCPGKCIFCPNDVKMPKSYLSREPGAQRAGMHQFDPYDQTLARMSALYRIGHPVDKIELIVLGGTWSFYSEPYQIWFLKRTFEALNDFGAGLREVGPSSSARLDFEAIDAAVDGRDGGNPYNRIVSEFAKLHDPSGTIEAHESASWDELAAVQHDNETAGARCVGLSLETRPDYVTEEEATRLRRLGATKIQIGYQSVSDDVLELNERGHDVAASRAATKLLRQAGFKIQAHWMPNLYGSTPERDVEDFSRLFSDPDFRPDELKLYPCSLIESAELMTHYEAGRYRPYTEGELLSILIDCMTRTPVYCRLSRVIRDIPGDDILAGSRVTNFRAIAEAEMVKRGVVSRDIRAREIRGEATDPEALRLEAERFHTSAGEEVFLQFVTASDRLAGFLRLCLPEHPAYIAEVDGAALVREVHVYGAAVTIGERDEGKSQHVGLGRRLLDEAAALALAKGFTKLAVISSVGTRDYYRRQGFHDGELYQHRSLG
jgi:elongator complex protein 3